MSTRQTRVGLDERGEASLLFWRTFCFWKWREDGQGGGEVALRLGEVGADVFSHQLLSMPTWRHNKIIHQLRLAASGLEESDIPVDGANSKFAKPFVGKIPEKEALSQIW